MKHMPDGAEENQDTQPVEVEESSASKATTVQLHDELAKIDEKEERGEELSRQELALVYGLIQKGLGEIQFLREPDEILVDKIISHRPDPRDDVISLLSSMPEGERTSQRFAKLCCDLVFSGKEGSVEYLEVLKKALPEDYEKREIYLFSLASSIYYSRLDENPQGANLVGNILEFIEKEEHPSLRTLKTLAYVLGNRELYDNGALTEENVSTALSIISLNLETAPSIRRNPDIDRNATYRSISRAIGRGLLKDTNLSDATRILLDTNQVENLNIEIARDTAEQVKNGIFGTENDPTGISLGNAMKIIETQFPTARRIKSQHGDGGGELEKQVREMLAFLSEAVRTGQVPESSLENVLKVIEEVKPETTPDTSTEESQ